MHPVTCSTVKNASKLSNFIGRTVVGLFQEAICNGQLLWIGEKNQGQPGIYNKGMQVIPSN
ncbi:hypothetical protein SAMN04487894_11955 [Niabella drilacis]|uniref:Uncharacterized protein n=1 Tax=Niabella drilacis (strain DSM 25811 / CCM 8410 / CCUG 62505 / LMG 26954 / E90) TaxID=1285928 RepID=A0A1G6ZTI3_NIADE|nr:hypothetical protein SAMN04487894_11955 [Niabella drilacis]